MKIKDLFKRKKTVEIKTEEEKEWDLDEARAEYELINSEYKKNMELIELNHKECKNCKFCIRLCNKPQSAFATYNADCECEVKGETKETYSCRYFTKSDTVKRRIEELRKL